MKKLLIVESPTKARTIGRMLDASYTIMASMGHVRDLPERTLGIDLAHDFTPQYVSSARSAKIIRDLRNASRRSDSVYLATDPDREGEAIAWHLSELLKDTTKQPFQRIAFHEITRDAIMRALSGGTSINMNLVYAQQARRILDRIVGYQVSPLLWSQLEKGISAGRVQSVALRLIVEREQAVDGFQREEYWVCTPVFCTKDGRRFACRLSKIDAEDFKISSKSDAETVLSNILNGTTPVVTGTAQTTRRRNAPPPFTTSTMQQAANTALHISASQSMLLAQKLYEGVELGADGSVGLITYMRTDSVNIAHEAQNMARHFISTTLGPQFIPGKPNVFKSRMTAQEAHEAIRPTDIRRTPEMVAPYLEPALLKLYTLIWRRFLASQMSQCVQEVTAVDISVIGLDKHNYTFHTASTIQTFPGFTKIYNDEQDTKREKSKAAEAEILSSLSENQRLAVADSQLEQKFTEPPPRYTEATLIKALEDNGIGRPSTYAQILRTIQQRRYVARERGTLVPTTLGRDVCAFLVTHLPELFNVGFTARMEHELDEIEDGSVVWTDMIHKFYAKFVPWLEKAKQHDAPAGDTVKLLLEKMSDVKFSSPEKRGRRTFDDAKFYKSIREKFDSSGRITQRQYQALLVIASRYDAVLQNSADLPPQLAADILAAKQRTEAISGKNSLANISEETRRDYEKLFSAFDSVKWAEPTVRRGRTYDDRKFFESLKRQAMSGRLLSEKQRKALWKIAEEYAESLPVDLIRDALKISPSEGSRQSRETAEEVASLLRGLKTVTSWAPPSKRGRYVYDDRKFYESLSSQHARGREFSPRQLAALKKLAAKYLNGTTESFMKSSETVG